jgi:transcriptional regulator with XRE-family HTH domain
MPKSIYTSEQAKLQLLLRRIRRDAGLTQEDLAAKLKRPQSFVSKYESGERRLDVLELREICSAMNITLIDFVNKMERALRDSGKR